MIFWKRLTFLCVKSEVLPATLMRGNALQDRGSAICRTAAPPARSGARCDHVQGPSTTSASLAFNKRRVSTACSADRCIQDLVTKDCSLPYEQLEPRKRLQKLANRQRLIYDDRRRRAATSKASLLPPRRPLEWEEPCRRACPSQHSYQSPLLPGSFRFHEHAQSCD